MAGWFHPETGDGFMMFIGLSIRVQLIFAIDGATNCFNWWISYIIIVIGYVLLAILIRYYFIANPPNQYFLIAIITK